MSEADLPSGWWARTKDWLRHFDRPPPGDSTSKHYGTVIEGYGRVLWARVRGAREAAAWREAVEADQARKAEETRRVQALDTILKDIEDALTRLPGSGSCQTAPSASELFSRILSAELRYFHVTDEADRFAAARAARERFTRVASANALAARNASQVPELKIPLSEPAVADTITLLNIIHARYLLDIARETEVARQEGILLFRLQRPVMVVGALMALTVAGALVFRVVDTLATSSGQRFLPDPLFATQVPYFLVGLLLIVLVGYAGSVISVAQRSKQATSRPVLEGDPVSTIGGIAAGWNGVLLAMASASIFSGIAYLLFASGIANLLGISGGLFPVPWSASECRGSGSDAVAMVATDHRTGPAVQRLGYVMGFCGGLDYVKMLVIAFVAGFSERLVPDMLQQIAARTSQRPQGRPVEVPPEELETRPPADTPDAAPAPADGPERRPPAPANPA